MSANRGKALVIGLLLVLLACGTLVYFAGLSWLFNPYQADGTPKMDQVNPKIAALFGHTQPICFGRFIIDLPVGAQLAWGMTQVPYDLDSYPNQADELEQEKSLRIKAFKDDQRRDGHPSSLIAVMDSINEQSKIVVGYDSSVYDSGSELYSYIRLGNNGYIQHRYHGTLLNKDLNPQPDLYKKYVEDLKSYAQLLRVRSNTEVPTDPGVCIDSGFMATPSSLPATYLAPERVQFGVRFPAYPDVSFSISTFITDRPSQDESLEYALEGGREAALASGQWLPWLEIRRLRYGDRRIVDWPGAEILTRMPASGSSPSVHFFKYRYIGMANDPLRPIVDIQLDTGVGGNDGGKVQPSLSNDEAIELWDRLTRSIRVRPTTEHATPPQLPLGTQGYNGHLCPQSGIWRAEQLNAEHREQHFTAGKRFPCVWLPIKRTLWQKLIRADDGLPADTTWTLIKYDKPED